MRKIIVFNLISIDGFFAGSDGNIDWHNVDDEFNTFAIEQTKTFGTILFGKTTYKLFEVYWPAALADPATSSDDRQIAQTIEDIEKIVFSKSIQDVSWKNTKLLHDVDPEEIKHWKESEGQDMAIFGSGTIVQQLANLGLIDEYRLLVNPVILGEGKPLFKNVHKLDLKLINTRTFGNGNVLLTYIP